MRERRRESSLALKLVGAAPFIGLALVRAVMIGAKPAVASVFGLDLLLMPALSLVLVTEAQMFVVGGSEIELGVGAFAGLISVLSATWLYDRPPLGALAIAAAVAAYADRSVHSQPQHPGDRSDPRRVLYLVGRRVFDPANPGAARAPTG